MLANTARIPQPNVLGPVDPNLLNVLSNEMPVGYSLERWLTTPQDVLCGDTHPESAKMFNALRPIAEVAIEDYHAKKAAQATHVALTIRNYATSNGPQEWHRDGIIYPDGITYAVSSHSGTEFAYGSGLPLLDKLGEKAPLDTLVNRLIAKDKLHVLPTAGGNLVGFDSSHIHRHPDFEQPRLTAIIDVYSLPLALAGVSTTLTGRFQLWRARRGDLGY